LYFIDFYVVATLALFCVTEVMKYIILLAAVLFFFRANSQNIQKVVVDASDSVSGYYLAVPPSSGRIKGVLVVFCPYRAPESILPETKLHNVAAANDLLTVFASVGMRLLPDESALGWMNKVFASVLSRYKVDSSDFAVGGFDLAGMSVLRFAELSREHPEQFSIHPSVIFGIASPVDLTGLYQLSERQIKKNYFPPAVGDSRFLLDRFNKEQGTPGEHPDHYTSLSPFSTAATSPGNERYLRNVAVRLYYDTDLDWQLKTRRNGYYDTDLPDGSELIDRLLLQGNTKAEFVASKQPGMRSNGNRHATAYSIVDETDCIQWIIRELHIFSPSNPMSYVGPYTFGVPDGWRIERSSFPPPFAPAVKLTGIEEIRFPAGWGVAGSEEYWSLAYLFWLDAGQKIDAAVLQENIKAYYDGLVVTGGGPVKHNIPADKMVPTRVAIKKVAAEPDDVDTYMGTVDMLDYMAMKPIRLNFMAHVKSCSDTKHFPVFLELSPKPFEDGLWYELKRMKKGFKCGE
jgi:hypothetical protein